MIRLTTHALERAVERIPGCADVDHAARILSAEVVGLAGMFAAGCTCFVRLSTGNRLVIVDGAVITVLPVEDYKWKVLRHRRPRFT